MEEGEKPKKKKDQSRRCNSNWVKVFEVGGIYCVGNWDSICEGRL